MGLETCLIIGQVSLNLFYWKKNLQTDICGQVVRLTRKKLTSRVRSFMARTLDEISKKSQVEGEA